MDHPKTPMLRIVSDFVEFQSLESEWNALGDHVKTPLLRHEWFAACAEAFCPPDQLHIIVRCSENGIDAIAPLAIRRSKGSKTIGFLGATYLGEPSGFLYKNRSSLEEIIAAIFKMNLPVNLTRLGIDSLESTMLQEYNKKWPFFYLKEGGAAPFLQIKDPWPQFEANISSRRRYDLRRARKRAEDLGKVQFEILCPKPESLDRYLEEIFLVEASGWKGRRGTALLFDRRLRHFFLIYSRGASRLGTLRLCFLRINNKPAAALLAIQQFNRFWVLKLGYDEVFSNCSPGILLVHETIHYAFQAGLEAYEFLGSDANWIQMWTDQKHPYISARIYPFSIKGQSGLARDILSAVGSRVFSKSSH